MSMARPMLVKLPVCNLEEDLPQVVLRRSWRRELASERSCARGCRNLAQVVVPDPDADSLPERSRTSGHARSSRGDIDTEICTKHPRTEIKRSYTDLGQVLPQDPLRRFQTINHRE